MTRRPRVTIPPKMDSGSMADLAETNGTSLVGEALAAKPTNEQQMLIGQKQADWSRSNDQNIGFHIIRVHAFCPLLEIPE
jgi:hypothetical protein